MGLPALPAVAFDGLTLSCDSYNAITLYCRKCEAQFPYRSTLLAVDDTPLAEVVARALNHGCTPYDPAQRATAFAAENALHLPEGYRWPVSERLTAEQAARIGKRHFSRSDMAALRRDLLHAGGMAVDGRYLVIDQGDVTVYFTLEYRPGTDDFEATPFHRYS